MLVRLLLTCLAVASYTSLSDANVHDPIDFMLGFLNRALDRFYSIEYSTDSEQSTLKIYAPVLRRSNVSTMSCESNICTFNLHLPAGFTIEKQFRSHGEPVTIEQCDVEVKFFIDLTVTKPLSVSVEQCALFRSFYGADHKKGSEKYLSTISQVLYGTLMDYYTKTNLRAVDFYTVGILFEHYVHLLADQYTPSHNITPTAPPNPMTTSPIMRT